MAAGVAGLLQVVPTERSIVLSALRLVLVTGAGAGLFSLAAMVPGYKRAQVVEQPVPRAATLSRRDPCEVVADTACDLPDDVANELGIVFVPLHVRFGTTELLDREQLSAKEFWARCAGSPELPKPPHLPRGLFSAGVRVPCQWRGRWRCMCDAFLKALGDGARRPLRPRAPSVVNFPVEVIDSF